MAGGDDASRFLDAGRLGAEYVSDDNSAKCRSCCIVRLLVQWKDLLVF